MAAVSSRAVIEGIYSAFRRGDIEFVLASLSEDVQWDSPIVNGAEFTGPRKGKAAVAEFFQELGRTGDIERFDPVEFVADGDKAVVLIDYRTRVKATGKTAEMLIVHFFTLQDGKITHFREIYDTLPAQHAFA